MYIYFLLSKSFPDLVERHDQVICREFESGLTKAGNSYCLCFGNVFWTVGDLALLKYILQRLGLVVLKLSSVYMTSEQRGVCGFCFVM